MTIADVLSLAVAQTPAPDPSGPTGGWMMILFWGLFFVAMWFLLIAPQRKKQKEHQKMLSAVVVGDEILTQGGIYGSVINVKDDRLIVRIADKTTVEVSRQFIASVDKKT